MPVIRLPLDIEHHPEALDRDAQQQLVDLVRGIVSEAPLYTPVMPRTGKPMSVRMTNCGSLGWVTDKDKGYRYQATHPLTGESWPQMPQQLLELWAIYAKCSKPPEACLINFYADDAKMGLHQDRDEQDLDAPVLSISLGNSCLFRIGGLERNAKTSSIKLQSGDIVVMGGQGRLAFHGVDRIYPGTSTLLKNGGRINLTLRRVNR